MPSAPVHPKLCLASFLPLRFPAPTFPGRAGGRAWDAQEGRSIPAGSCLALPRRALRERGQGEVLAVAALVTCQDAQRGRGRPRWRARSQDPESTAAGGVWVSDLDCEPRLCWGGVEGPAGYSLPHSRKCPLSSSAPRGRCGPLPKGPGRPGGGAGRGHRGSQGNPLGFPDAYPVPHRKAGVGKGRAGWWGPLKVSNDISRVWEASCSAEPGQRAGVIVPEPGWSQH